MLSRVKLARLPSTELFLRCSLGQDTGKDIFRYTNGGFRDVCTSTKLYGKAREKPKKRVMSEKKLTRHFVDYRRVKLEAGSGGKGACTFHSEPRKEWGGPDGGDGGDGGSIIIKANRFVKSLANVVPVYRGESGQSGGSKNCHGRNGCTTYISLSIDNKLMALGWDRALLEQQQQLTWKLVDTYKNHLEAVIKNKGYAIDY